ncbi:MAG: hypothetical protein U0939_02390 [Pirellulales bacterium]
MSSDDDLPITRRTVLQWGVLQWGVLLGAPTFDLNHGLAEETQREQRWPRFNGRDLTGWQIASRDFFDKHGEVGWRDGAVHLGVGRPGTAISWTGEMPRIDYEVTLEAKRVSGDDFFCGLTFPIHEAYCTLILGGWGGGTTGLSNIDGFSAVENETTDYLEVKPNHWHRVRLRAARRQILAEVDGRKIVDLDPTDKKFEIWWEQEPVRPFGIASWNTAAALRSLKVTSL